ncbi:MAG: hypothetical protein KAH32_03495 [Chlamydiia bacterium]|nr:hypothetical protein [Chlamydiia bacterium]
MDSPSTITPQNNADIHQQYIAANLKEVKNVKKNNIEAVKNYHELSGKKTAVISTATNKVSAAVSKSLSGVKTSITEGPMGKISSSVSGLHNINNSSVQASNHIDSNNTIPPINNNAKLTVAEAQKAKKSIEQILLDIKKADIILQSTLYAVLARVISSSAASTASMSIVSSELLTKSIANSKALVKKINKKIYDAAHQSWWQKLVAFFKKAVSAIEHVFTKLIAAVCGKAEGAKISGWFKKMNKTLLGALDKVIGKALKGMGMSNKAVAAFVDIANILVEVEEMAIPGLSEAALLTGAVGITDVIPGFSIVSSIQKAGTITASYAKDTLKDPTLAQDITLGSSIASAVVQVIMAIGMMVASGGTAGPEAAEVISSAVEDIVETAGDVSADLSEDAGSSAEGLGDASEDGAEGAEGEGAEGEDDAGGDEEVEQEENQELETSVQDMAKEDQGLKSKILRVLKKLKNIVTDGKKLGKLANRMLAIGSIIQGIANTSSGITSIEKGKMEAAVSVLYKEKALIDAAASETTQAIGVQSGQATRSRAYLALFTKSINSVSESVSETLNAQLQTAQNISRF